MNGLPASMSAGALVPSPQELLEASLERAREYARESLAVSTRRAYKADLEAFLAFCTRIGRAPFPASPDELPELPALVAAFVAAEADRGLSVSTLEGRLAALARAYRDLGYADPCGSAKVRQVMEGVRRVKGVRAKAKKALDADLVRKAIRPIDREISALEAAPSSEPAWRRAHLVAIRDRAMILLGFAGAFRRSELAGLALPHGIEHVRQGAIVRLDRSKTDQRGQGREVPVRRARGSLCPVSALQRWLEAAGIATGAVFRAVKADGTLAASAMTTQAMADALKRRLGQAGLPPMDFGMHSLRAGFVTAALDNDRDALRVMKVTGHEKVDTLARYDRRDHFRDHAGEGLLDEEDEPAAGAAARHGQRTPGLEPGGPGGTSGSEQGLIDEEDEVRNGEQHDGQA